MGSEYTNVGYNAGSKGRMNGKYEARENKNELKPTRMSWDNGNELELVSVFHCTQASISMVWGDLLTFLVMDLHTYLA